MRAAARIVAAADGRGGTRFEVLSGEAPLLLRRTGPVRVHLVGGAAGPLGGDDLRLDVTVGPGARLCLASVAATIALPGRGSDESRLTVRVTVAAGGALDWQPEPLIAATGCRHRTVSLVELAAGARLSWREELVCGRSGEPSGDVTLHTDIRYAGRPLYRNDLAVGPTAEGWAGPAVLGGGRIVGTVVVVDPDWADAPPAPPAPGPSGAAMALSGPAMLATAVGTELREVRAALTTGTGALIR